MYPENLQIHLAHIVLKKYSLTTYWQKKILFQWLCLLGMHSYYCLCMHTTTLLYTLLHYDHSIHSCYE